LVSNILFPIGTSMTERFVFIPSLGFCFIAAYYINKLATSTQTKLSSNKTDKELIPGISILKNKTCAFILVLLIGFYSIKTIARNMDWKNNLTLFTADVATSPNSANLNKDIGNSFVEAGKLITDKKHQLDTFNIAKPYLKRAIKIYSGYTDAYRMLGFIYYMDNKFDSAYYFNDGGLKIKPDDAELNYNQGKVLDKQKKYDEAIKVLNHAVEINPKYEGAYYNLALSYTNKGDGEKGLEYFKKVIELNPKRSDAFYYSGLIYQAKKDSVKAKEYLEKAKSLGGVNANSNN
jgi:tetratricopeptide (TPR) repeat protein